MGKTALTLLACLIGSSALAQVRPVLRPGTVLEPVNSPCISSPFGPRVIPGHPQAGTYHYGVDLPAPEGAEVKATAAGTVIRVQHRGPGGLEILVQHAGYVGVYSHLGTVNPLLMEGKSSVAAGEKLGVVGNTGVTFGMHLYFEMITDHPIDPAPYLNVPLCQGISGTVRHQTGLEIVRAGGKLPPSRRYLDLSISKRFTAGLDVPP